MGFFRNSRKEREEEYRPSDIFALILAALQLILPFVLLLLLAVGLVYGLFLLLFH